MFRTRIRKTVDFWKDPLSHPSIARMSERERADLPFDRTCRDQARP